VTTPLPAADDQRSPAEIVAAKSPEWRQAWYDKIGENVVRDLRHHWPFWARPKQRTPPGDWRVWLLRTGRGWGKCLALDTPISTPSGWTTMGELKRGDTVYDIQGIETKVTRAEPVLLGNKCFEITFSDHTKIVADADHEWLTWDKAARKAFGRAANPRTSPAIRTTKQISETLRVGKKGEANHSIDVVAIQGSIVHLHVDPYTLGFWLGDGDSKAAAVTTEDPEVLEHLESLGHRISAPYGQAKNRYSVGTKPPRRENGAFAGNDSLHSRLKEIGVLRNKHIPQAYLRASYLQRLELLRGLMDSDGCIEPNGRAEFMSTRKVLAEGTLELIRSLGVKAVMGEGRAMLNGKDCGPKYRIQFTPYVPIFRLPRKLDRVKGRGKQALRQGRRYIVDVKPVESVPVRCIRVDSLTHMFLCSESFIPTHNTRTAAEWVREQVETNERGAFVGRTTSDVRKVMIEGKAGILSVFPPHQKPKYEPSKRTITFHNGCEITCFTSDEPEQLRGPEHGFAWCDELCAWDNIKVTWDMLKLTLRTGNKPRAVVTTTPKPTKFIKKLSEHPRTYLTLGSTYENAKNLAPWFLEALLEEYEGTTLGEQELHGRILEEDPRALWKRDNIIHIPSAPDLDRLVVAVDPSTTKTGDEAGIISGGVAEGIAYILRDSSVRASPQIWCERAIGAFEELLADRIVAETNQGGEMVETILRTINDKIPYRPVHASRGKKTRAEPVAALYEQGKVLHVGVFDELEDEFCSWVPGVGPSPNRLDAAVYCITDLLLGGGSVGSLRLSSEDARRPRGFGF
jgi:phage terminase large subunit-like protein